MRRLKNQKGFSLIEVMVACVLLTTAIIPLASVLISNHNMVYRTEEMVMAANLVAVAAEEVRTEVFTDLASQTLADYAGSGYTLSKTVTSVGTGANLDKLKRVDLQILDGTDVMAEATLVVYERGL